MTAPRSAGTPTDHAGHDLLRVAEAADRGGRLPTELAGCPDCVALHADLVALAAALPSAAVPVRPRAYTLTPADAARLRPGGWRRILEAIGSSRDVITRPLAIGFTTLGLAGLLVATVPGVLPGSGGTAGSPAGGTPADGQGQVELPAAAPSMEPMNLSAAPEVSAAPAAESTDDDVFSGVDSGDPAASPTGGADARTDATPPVEVEAAVRDDVTGVSTLIVVAGALLIVGLGLFGLRWSARKL